MSRRWDWGPPPRPRRPWTGLAGALVGAIVALERPWLGVVVITTALALVTLEVVAPGPTGRILSAFARVVGRTIGWAALSVVFVLVVVPLGLLRVARMSLQFPGTEASYWRPHEPRAPDARKRWS